ncbi:MAG: HD domain-containing protein [Lachnospiraceae bacterium]|nr:HD domain-containing protein [Lachnospiraceae bacterium]
MERIEKILKHPLYQSNCHKIEQLEAERIFCRHGIDHSLDVARILYILILERRLDLPKDIIYATALLHDIGRAVEYEESRPHHEAGAGMAREILRDCGYTESEAEQISSAIISHKCGQTDDRMAGQDILLSLLYEADKLSRNCFDCKAQGECYWKEEQRNHTIKY